MTGQTFRFKHLVVDSGPLIQDSWSPNISEYFYTIPEVLGEIKDVSTMERIDKQPFKLNIRNPSEEALQIVKSFAKITGDLASLSSVDLKVVALTLTLELESNGIKSKMRKTPLEMRTHEASPKINQNAGKNPNQPQMGENDKVNVKGPKTNSPSKEESEEEGGGQWITPENIKEINLSMPKSNILPANVSDLVSVGCISTDFAVQNLLLQMRLKVFGPNGYRIKQVKNWLLRCHACYWITKQMDRRFCDRCGNNTLIRTSYKVDDYGQVHLFLKKDFTYNLRGTKAPLPLPKTGRNGNSVLLREDQKEYQQAMKSFTRSEKSSLSFNDLNAVDDRLAMVFGEMSVKSNRNNSMNGPPVIGFGRRNPNQARRKV